MKNLIIATQLSVLMSAPSFAMDASTNLTVGLIEQDRQPYWLLPKKGEQPTGAYIDILNEVSKITGISFSYKFAPQARLRRYMLNQVIDIEPGIDDTWRTEPGEAESSVYSIPFYASKEVVAYLPSRLRSPELELSLNDFEHDRPCSVLGFDTIEHKGYESTDYFKAITEQQMIMQLKLGRCDFAIFPIDVIQKELDYGYLISSKPISTYQLKLRLSKKKQHLLGDINSAIQTIKDRGDIQRIMDSYKD
ncbi:ABC transporter substrate-binding protein [Vibrio sp. THAF190c]|uniref:substrate-binding periplasmic protein n=1 Tax=Vibrio sp. THAF190c TaxID=2587865 RepID=UPI001267F42A|nr:ABC transporter substrate-binding protein [Vibrio sp. THAF190c]QFT13555.1 Bacterial extracellular solute-binding protein, family 3 [Vibrio sp. THAF190c]